MTSRDVKRRKERLDRVLAIVAEAFPGCRVEAQPGWEAEIRIDDPRSGEVRIIALSREVLSERAVGADALRDHALKATELARKNPGVPVRIRPSGAAI